MAAERILVVDDERAGRLSLAEILRLEGFVVEMAENGEQAVARLAAAGPPFDLMLLDLKMPGLDGMGVLAEAGRLSPDMQIIFLTAHGSLESAIAAVRHGAHDYLLKPSPAGEILKSIRRALERRRSERRRLEILEALESSVRALREDSPPGEPGLAAAPGSRRRIEAAGLTVDLEAHAAQAEDQAVTLTPSELRLLALLLRQPGVVVSPAEIVREVQGYAAGGPEAAEIVRPLVSRLRRKLAQLPGMGECVSTVKGAGYRFARRQ